MEGAEVAESFWRKHRLDETLQPRSALVRTFENRLCKIDEQIGRKVVACTGSRRIECVERTLLHIHEVGEADCKTCGKIEACSRQFASLANRRESVTAPKFLDGSLG